MATLSNKAFHRAVYSIMMPSVDMLSCRKVVAFLLVLTFLSYCECSNTNRGLAEKDEHQVDDTLGAEEKFDRFKRQSGGKGAGKGKGVCKIFCYFNKVLNLMLSVIEHALMCVWVYVC